jgi:hypothetical protein
MNWKPVELIKDYWIILDGGGYDEYQDENGDNLMFTTKQEALDKIKEIEYKQFMQDHFQFVHIGG